MKEKQNETVNTGNAKMKQNERNRKQEAKNVYTVTNCHAVWKLR